MVGAHLRDGIKEAQDQMERMFRVQRQEIPWRFGKNYSVNSKEDDIPAGVTRSMVRISLKAMNDFYREVKKKREAAGQGGLFSDDFWKTFGAKNLEDFLNSLSNVQYTGRGCRRSYRWQEELMKVQQHAADQP